MKFKVYTVEQVANGYLIASPTNTEQYVATSLDKSWGMGSTSVISVLDELFNPRDKNGTLLADLETVGT